MSWNSWVEGLAAAGSGWSKETRWGGVPAAKVTGDPAAGPSLELLQLVTNQFSVFTDCHCIQATQGKCLGLWDGQNVNAIFKIAQQDRKLRMRELHLFHPSNQETWVCLQDKALYVKKGRAWPKFFGSTGEARLCTGITERGEYIGNQPGYSSHAVIWLLHFNSRHQPWVQLGHTEKLHSAIITSAKVHSAISTFI